MALDTDVPCTGAEKYGMYHGRPCVILKMNNIYGWEPRPYYNLTQINNIVGMPTWLKTTITNHYNKHCLPLPKKARKKCPQMRMIWLSCEGETAADEEHMGKVHYVPWQGFPGYYYPYLNQQHYLSPIVFIQFRNITPGVLIQVRCKIWARNIQHDPTNPRKGGIHFEILMD
ncbi:sodium/potassium-transporting ATPase subunit beta-2 [Eurytemora carolleeae]|uniref:sodium/potassium-transporting ATPase subunit beta-2 n=1 Tax=Eurytemora carolleeae TaxID=1294199 RepID=UPI000C765E66|nr:sodium/potassium-transporting ATPase subunit beta-2 [Eurytemora carolleeae]|eukprot:XP_023349243.1 sodium/potassium-transporting ATPase subunit beta-2-like [Eurytemora affinis]